MNSVLEGEKAKNLLKAKSIWLPNSFYFGKKSNWNEEKREIVDFRKNWENWLYEAIRNCTSL
jgi:hypothetical protein